MAEWKIDIAHSIVEFKVQHLGISWVRGIFSGVEGNVNFEQDNFKDISFQATLDINSIDSGNKMRDGHLKSPDFFDGEKYPKATVKSTKVVSNTNDSATVEAELTIKDKTQKVLFEIKHLGSTDKTNQDGTTNKVSAFSAKAKFNRDDFGINWNMDLPNGKFLVGKEIELQIDIETLK